MLRIHQSKSVSAAKSYYSTGLEQGDYYAQEAGAGLWFGKAAEILGLNGEVSQEEFHALCDNLHPGTGKKLNPRNNAVRTVGYDMTFSAPKSISILHGVYDDDRILASFQKAVRETMRHIEADAMVRVRRNGQVEDRVTGNLVWAEFTHLTSRPVDGLSDPNLHIHAYSFNTSHDSGEDRFKAGKFLRIKQNAPYYQAIFHSKLAGEMKRLGYGISNQRLGFEVTGIPREMIEIFSRRTAQIEALAAELGISGNKKAMSELAARTRSGKDRKMSRGEMKAEWRERAKGMKQTGHSAVRPAPQITAEDAVGKAISSSFERHSVFPYKRLIAEALQISFGSCNLEKIGAAFERRDDLVLIDDNGKLQATTIDVLDEEKLVLEFLRKTRGAAHRMNGSYKAAESMLDCDQKAALEALMKSPDRVFVIQGRAGTGKTTLLREAASAMEAVGEKLMTLAPTSEAAHVVLKGEGFAQSETIQQFLINPKLQEEARHAVLWIDESGLLSVREMRKLLDIAGRYGNRVVLSGDSRQHSSVERGDALRLVAESGLVTVRETRSIYRQKSEDYRKAIKHLSRGEVESGFAILESMDAIREYRDFPDKLRKLADDYLKSSQQFGDVLLVSPTHFEGQMVTRQIRETLKREGIIGTEEVVMAVNRNRHLTTAEKQLPYFYEEGQIVQFQRAVRGSYRRGEKLTVRKVSDDAVFVGRGHGEELQRLDLNLASHFDLMRQEELSIAAGDKVRLLGNIRTETGKRLCNGSVHQVEGWTPEHVILAGGYRVASQSGILDHGYVSTSHASQGRTTGKVILSQGSWSRGASSLEQFYVSASRGRFEVSVYTDDKQELLNSIRHSGQRQLAVELTGNRKLLEEESVRQAQLHWEETAALEVG